jgi:hypothetical protein
LKPTGAFIFLTFVSSLGFSVEPPSLGVVYLRETKLPEALRKDSSESKALQTDFFTAKVNRKDSTQTKTARNCADFWRALTDGPVKVEDGSDTIYPDSAAACEELKIRRHLQPAQKSFIERNGLKMAELPAALLNSESEAAWFELRNQASRNGTSCKSYLSTIAEDKDDETACEAEVVAFGDWNKDGLDDVVVVTSSAARSDWSEIYFVLTRKDKDVSYRVIDGWTHYANQFGVVGPDEDFDRRGWKLFNIDGDLGCSGDALDMKRKDFKSLYDARKVSKAFETLDRFYESCGSRLSDNQKVWPLSDLALAASKQGLVQRCESYKKQMKTLPTEHMPAKAMSALKFNLSKCPGKKPEKKQDSR